MNEGCQRWQDKFIELIDTDTTDIGYISIRETKYNSCHLESLISYRNGTTGVWQLFNLTGNVLVMENVQGSLNSLQIKVFYNKLICLPRGLYVRMEAKAPLSTGLFQKTSIPCHSDWRGF